jgi:hypothetical protein
LRLQDYHSVEEFRRGEAVALASSPRTVAFFDHHFTYQRNFVYPPLYSSLRNPSLRPRSKFSIGITQTERHKSELHHGSTSSSEDRPGNHDTLLIALVLQAGWLPQVSSTGFKELMRCMLTSSDLTNSTHHSHDFQHTSKYTHGRAAVYANYANCF